jgi:hypothetical protein
MIGAIEASAWCKRNGFGLISSVSWCEVFGGAEKASTRLITHRLEQ